MISGSFAFCPMCAAPLARIPSCEDQHIRSACTACGYVHYENPAVLVSCLITFEHKLLWIKRGTEPRRGYWTQPGGFMESGECPEAAAARELEEETGVKISPDELTLYAIGSLPDISEVYLVYRGSVSEDAVFATPEAEELGFFSATEAPWAEQAYPEVVDVLHRFYSEHAQARYGVYSCSYSNGINRYWDVTRSADQD